MDNFIIAVTRTCGGGATAISKILAAKYHISLYDRKLLQLASEDSGINEKLFAAADETMKQSSLYKVSKKIYNMNLMHTMERYSSFKMNGFNIPWYANIFWRACLRLFGV